MKMPDAERKRYEKYMMNLMSEKDTFKAAREEGMKEGREKGMKEGIIRMNKLGMSIEQILSVYPEYDRINVQKIINESDGD